MIGWDLILEYALGAADGRGRLVGLRRALLADFGLLIPPAYTAPFGADLVEVAPGHWQIMAANLAAQLTSQGIDPASLPHGRHHQPAGHAHPC